MAKQAKRRSGEPVVVSGEQPTQEFHVPADEYARIQAALAAANVYARSGNTALQGFTVWAPEPPKPKRGRPANSGAKPAIVEALQKGEHPDDIAKRLDVTLGWVKDVAAELAAK